MQAIEHLQRENQQLKITNEMRAEHNLEKKKIEIQRLMEEKDNHELQAKARYEALSDSKKEMERTYEERIK